MRVNHTGEICAQALYQSQALIAKAALTKQGMQQAAQEENDHLAWCHQRLLELNSRTSYLAVFWYIMSFGLGTFAGFAGDRWSLGFVVETERQVVAHLDKHLSQLPISDVPSAKILQQMREDEAEHASSAVAAGAEELPQGIKLLMRGMAKLMTMTTYWL
jgi:ubiquinone biosynthesis monooxygenase Coq7